METTRELALAALDSIWQDGDKPKDILDDLSGTLDSRERGFLMELVYGVVRFRDTLDWALKPFLRKPSGLGGDTVNNLRLAAYQILFMRVPPHAAVNEAVEIAKRSGRPDVVNAVLRNLLRVPDDIRLNFDEAKKKGPVPFIALSTSHPQWLIKRWVRRFGEEDASALAEADNRIPPMTLRANVLGITREGLISRLADMGIEGHPTPVSPRGIRLKEFRPYKELSDLSGLFTVQDEASQLISFLLEPRQGERVLDACAAPGGKASHIAELMEDKGEIIAVEFDRRRMERLGENLSRLRLSSVKTVQADILEYSPEERFDRILLDAPCSALGVIRRNPDVKYRRRPEHLRQFRSAQVKMLRHVAGLLRPGGIIVYSVCSTEPEEGEEVIKEFLKESAKFYIIDTALPFLKGLMKDGFLRTYPHVHDMDGFFGVRLCSRA